MPGKTIGNVGVASVSGLGRGRPHVPGMVLGGGGGQVRVCVLFTTVLRSFACYQHVSGQNVF